MNKTIYVGFNSVTKEPWFHNYQYKYMLRFPDDMSRYKGHKKTLTKWFDRKYSELKQVFIQHDLEPDGYSEMHTILIAEVFGLNAFELLGEYHG